MSGADGDGRPHRAAGPAVRRDPRGAGRGAGAGPALRGRPRPRRRPAPRPGVSDALADTVDYGAVADVVAATVSGPAPSPCWRRWPGTWPTPCWTSTTGSGAVTVALRKLRPPLAVDIDTVGVRVARTPVTAPSAERPARPGVPGARLQPGRPAGPPAPGRRPAAGRQLSRRHRRLPGLRDRAGRAAPRTRAPTSTWWSSWPCPRRWTPTGCSSSATAWRPRPTGCGPSGGAPGPSTSTCVWIDGIALDDPDLTRAPPPVAGAPFRAGPARRAGPRPGRTKPTSGTLAVRCGSWVVSEQQFRDFL